MTASPNRIEEVLIRRWLAEHVHSLLPGPERLWAPGRDRLAAIGNIVANSNCRPLLVDGERFWHQAHAKGVGVYAEPAVRCDPADALVLVTWRELLDVVRLGVTPERRQTLIDARAAYMNWSVGLTERTWTQPETPTERSTRLDLEAREHTQFWNPMRVAQIDIVEAGLEARHIGIGLF